MTIQTTPSITTYDTTETKLTYVEALNYAIDHLPEADAKVIEKLTALRDQTAKRNAAKVKKPTKTQVANLELKEQVKQVMSDGETRTVADIMTLVPELTSVQKATAIVRALVTDGVLVRTEEKRKSFYTLA